MIKEIKCPISPILIPSKNLGKIYIIYQFKDKFYTYYIEFMHLSYAQNKVHIYKWRTKEGNYVQTKLINLNSNKRCYAWKKIQMIYLNILLN